MSVLTTTRKIARIQELPVYRQIEMDLRTRLMTGEWTGGEMLPSRRDMARDYGVDVNTFQRAITPLVQEGLLRADGGRGTFVLRSEAAAPKVSPVETVSSPAVTSRIPVSESKVQRPLIGRTLGIIAAYPPEDVWMRTVVTTLELTFSSYGGQSKLFNLIRPNQHPDKAWVPIKDAVEHLTQDPIDALIVIAIYDKPGTLEDVQASIAPGSMPLVYICWDDIRRPIHHVYYDNKMAGYQAAKHLIDCGYSEFTFFAPFSATWVEERIAHARAALRDAGIPESNLRVYPSEQSTYQFGNHAAEGYQAAISGFRSGSFSEAIITANDRLAQGLLRAAEERGLTAGSDISVIGFDDDAGSREMGLTTLRPPLEALGREGGRLIRAALEGDTEPIQVRLNSQLILRSTTRSIRPHHAAA